MNPVMEYKDGRGYYRLLFCVTCVEILIPITASTAVILASFYFPSIFRLMQFL